MEGANRSMAAYLTDDNQCFARQPCSMENAHRESSLQVVGMNRMLCWNHQGKLTKSLQSKSATAPKLWGGWASTGCAERRSPSARPGTAGSQYCRQPGSADRSGAGRSAPVPLGDGKGVDRAVDQSLAVHEGGTASEPAANHLSKVMAHQAASLP